MGNAKFHSLCDQAQRGTWAALPISPRVETLGKALVRTCNGNYTREIDDHIESPSVNCTGLARWTLYEVSLAFTRMERARPARGSEADLLRCIELERYRGGPCDGGYLSRRHHLEDVFYDNERRDLGRNIKRSPGGVPVRRNFREMQVAWRNYRSLRNYPASRTGIDRVEARVSALPVSNIPKGRVSRIESQLQDGDILAIASTDNGGYTSHVGLALRDGNTCRFMHATSSRDKGRRCVVDGRISTYLAERRDHMGLIVFRPHDVA